MKRVLIITYYWPPSGGAGVQRWLKFSKFLPQFGWKPVILTVDDAKATYPIQDESLMEEIGGDIEVIRTDSREWFSVYKKVSGSQKVPYAGFANESEKTTFKQKLARFARGNFFLPDPRRGWNKFAVKAARKLILDTGIDYIVTTGPPHSSHLIGHKLSKEFSIPWMADFRDPWTDIYYYKQFYPTWIARKIDLSLEKKVLRDANKILTVSRGLKEIFQNKKLISGEKVKIIPNGYDEEDFQQGVSPANTEFIITYVGTLSDIYTIDQFIDAFIDLLDELPTLKLQFIGSVSNNQLLKLRRIPPEKIDVIDYVEHKKAVRYMEASNVLLLVIPEHSSGMGILTGKIFEYMATERDILGIGPTQGDSALMLKETGAGIMHSFKDTDGIKSTIKQFYKSSQDGTSGKSGKKYLKYSRKNLTSELAGYMNLP